MAGRGRPKNRVFRDMLELRETAEGLLAQGKYRITYHSKDEHPEFSDVDRVSVSRWGGQDQPDRNRDPSDGIYVCWASHPRHGRCRGVYAIEPTPAGEILVIITVMRE